MRAALMQQGDVPGLTKSFFPRCNSGRKPGKSLNSIRVPGRIRTCVKAVKVTEQLATITHC
jgi:hypothetical protein